MQQTALATREPSHNAAALILDVSAYDSMNKLAQLMADGKASVPQHLRGNPADCMAVIIQAMSWQMNPFSVAQKTFVVNGGQLSYEAQLVNAVIATHAPITGRLEFEWFGHWERILGNFRTVEYQEGGKKKSYRVPNWSIHDEEGLGVRVWATFEGEEKPRVLETLMVQARTRNSTLWADDPKQQIAYLATKKWARLYCPDVILGVYTPDEFESSDLREVGEAQVTQQSGSQAQPNKPAKPVSTVLADGQVLPIKADHPETMEAYEVLLAASNSRDISVYEKAWKALKPPQRAAIGAECHTWLKNNAATVADAEFTEVREAQQ